MEDGIPGWLQHCHETCCEKGGHHGKQACMVWRWFHHGDVILDRCCSNHLSQGQMITQLVNLLEWKLSGNFIRELDKEPLLN